MMRTLRAAASLRIFAVARALLAGAGIIVAVNCAQSQTPEKPRLTLGVGGKALLYYLPLTIAERKGYFREQGLTLDIQSYSGGAQSLQGLVEGSVDVVTGAYEHTLRMQAKGQDIRAVIELGRLPAIAVGVKKGRKWEGIADFKGMKIGVSSLGASTNLLMNFVIAKAGLAQSDATYVAAQSPLGAIQRGEIDAVSHLEPMISYLERSGEINIVIDTRTEKGTRDLFGGANPAAMLYMPAGFIEANPKTVQALVNALYKSLVWLKSASPEDIAASVPEEYMLGDRPLYLAAASKSKPSYSLTGISDPAGMQSTHDMLVRFDAGMKGARVDLKKTFDDRFVKRAAELVK